MIAPDSKLQTVTELQERLQVIYRARHAESERPAANRRGEGSAVLQAKQRAKLEKLDKRADSIRARIKALAA
jgi:hypothetical protein